MPQLKMPPIHSPWTQDLAWILDPTNDLSVELSPFRSYQLDLDSPGTMKKLYQWFSVVDQLNASPVSFTGRLGDYFENLLAFCFAQCPLLEASVVSRNQQIMTEQNGMNRTLGELDFLLDLGKELIHLEVAVKFYLLEDVNSDRWIGPNGHDSLHRKLARMRNHQLPMGSAVAGEKRPSHSLYWLKGILFSPWRQFPPHTLRYAWVHLAELPKLLGQEHSRWNLLEKEHWIGGWTLQPTDQQYLTEEIEKRLQTRNAAMLIEQGSSTLSARRVMVVNNAWPIIK